MSHGISYYCQPQIISEKMFKQFYELLDRNGLKKDAYFELDQNESEINRNLVATRIQENDYPSISISFHLDGKGLTSDEMSYGIQYGLLDISFDFLSDQDLVRRQMKLALPLLKDIHNFIPFSIGIYNINGLVDEERTDIVQGVIRKLYPINFWPRFVYENLGLDRINSLAGFSIEALEHGGLLIYYPLEKLGDNNFMSTRRKAQKALGLDRISRTSAARQNLIR